MKQATRFPQHTWIGLGLKYFSKKLELKVYLQQEEDLSRLINYHFLLDLEIYKLEIIYETRLAVDGDKP